MLIAINKGVMATPNGESNTVHHALLGL